LANILIIITNLAGKSGAKNYGGSKGNILRKSGLRGFVGQTGGADSNHLEMRKINCQN
jgi:hypothetical protein